jgi:hypothetical protein
LLQTTRVRSRGAGNHEAHGQCFGPCPT